MAKLNFAIEDVEVIDDSPDSQFATASIEAFSTGLSLHDTICDEEVLTRTAPTIYEKPIIFEYDYMLGDFGGHPVKPVISGFVVKDSATFSKRPDGRTTLKVMAKIWKKYSGKFMGIFRNTGKDNKKVSVEIEIKDSENKNGILEIKDFVYSAICVLGDTITEASPGANMQMLSFSKDENDKYRKAFEKEFSVGKYTRIDFKIPPSVKKNVKKSMEAIENDDIAVTGVAKSIGKFLSKNETITPERARQLYSQYSSMMKRAKDDAAFSVAFNLIGGNAGRKWIEKVVGEMDDEDNKLESYFSLYGYGETEKEEDGDETIMDKNKPDKVEKTEMAVEEPVQPEEKPKEEGFAETPAEEPKPEEKPFALSDFADMEILKSYLKTEEGDSEEEQFCSKMALEELPKEKDFNFGAIIKGMYSKMCKMAATIKAKDENEKVYMAENEELKKFKHAVEEDKKDFEVKQTLMALKEKVIVPEDAETEMLEESKKFSINDIETWKNYCKAKSFDFAVKPSNKKTEFNRIGLPFTTATPTSNKSDVWANKG